MSILEKITSYAFSYLKKRSIDKIKQKSILIKFCGFLLVSLFSTAVQAELTRSWSNVGGTWQASTPSGDVTVRASISGSMGGLTAGTMGCAGSYSLAAVDNHPSFQFYHDLLSNPGSITFSFFDSSNNPVQIFNPIINVDRVGGLDNTTSNSSLWTLTGGLTWVELSENDTHFVTTTTDMQRTSNVTVTGGIECGPPLVGTAAGSMQIQTPVTSITLNATRPPGSIGSLGDEIELIFSGLIIYKVIDAINDDFTGTPINNTGGTTSSVVTADTLDGNLNPIIGTDVTISTGTTAQDGTTTLGSTTSGISINPATGQIIVAPGTATGTHTYTYEICEVGNPTNCDIAVARVLVVLPTVNLRIIKTVNDTTPNIGDTITFSLAVENLGPDTATDVSVTDIVPAGFTYVSGSMTGIPASGGVTGDQSTPTAAPGLSWTIDTLTASPAAGSSTTLSFQAVVNAP